jgi:hypothetical protein
MDNGSKGAQELPSVGVHELDGNTVEKKRISLANLAELRDRHSITMAPHEKS